MSKYEYFVKRKNGEFRFVRLNPKVTNIAPVPQAIVSAVDETYRTPLPAAAYRPVRYPGHELYKCQVELIVAQDIPLHEYESAALKERNQQIEDAKAEERLRRIFEAAEVTVDAVLLFAPMMRLARFGWFVATRWGSIPLNLAGALHGTKLVLAAARTAYSPTQAEAVERIADVYRSQFDKGLWKLAEVLAPTNAKIFFEIRKDALAVYDSKRYQITTKIPEVFVRARKAAQPISDSEVPADLTLEAIHRFRMQYDQVYRAHVESTKKFWLQLEYVNWQKSYDRLTKSFQDDPEMLRRLEPLKPASGPGPRVNAVPH